MLVFAIFDPLTLRLNYLVHELAPLGYHLANIALHALVTLLYHQVSISIIIITKSFFYVIVPK